MRAKYDVRTCCGDLIASVVVDAYGDFDEDSDYSRCDEVCKDAGYSTSERCGCCYDRRVRAEFVGYVGDKVNDLFFDFVAGKVSGDIVGANKYDLIVALEAVVAALRDKDDPVNYIQYMDGEIVWIE